MIQRLAFLFSLITLLAAAVGLVAGCGTTTITERVTQLVVLTAEVPEVTRLVTVEVTREVEVTVLVTRVWHETDVITATPVPRPDRLSEAAAYQAALRWLVEQQQASGGFGSAKQTAWTVLALHAAGLDPETILTENGRSPFTHLESMIADNLIVGAETTALTALALKASGREVPEAVGIGSPPYPGASVWPALPLTTLALDRRTPPEVVAALAESAGDLQDAEWAAWSIMALSALSSQQVEDSEALISAALDYLSTAQDAGNLWPAVQDGEADALASALAIQALMAAGENMVDWNNPARALFTLQRDDGSFDGDLVATAAAIVALRETWVGALVE